MKIHTWTFFHLILDLIFRFDHIEGKQPRTNLLQINSRQPQKAFYFETPHRISEQSLEELTGGEVLRGKLLLSLECQSVISSSSRDTESGRVTERQRSGLIKSFVPIHEQHRPDFIFMDNKACRGRITEERLLEARGTSNGVACPSSAEWSCRG